MKSKIDFIAVFFTALLFLFILVCVNFKFVQAIEYTFLGLGQSFWGSLLGATISGGIAILIMNNQHKVQQGKEEKIDNNTLKTTKYLLENRNSFQSIQAFLILNNIKEHIKGKSEEDEKIIYLNFYHKNELVIKNFIHELHAIRKDLVIYISNKIIDEQSIILIDEYTRKVDSIIYQHNIIVRFLDEGKSNLKVYWTIIEMLNAVYDYENFIQEHIKD